MQINRSITPAQLEKLRADVNKSLRRGEQARQQSVEAAATVAADQRLTPGLRLEDEPKVS